MANHLMMHIIVDSDSDLHLHFVFQFAFEFDLHFGDHYQNKQLVI